MHSNKSSYCNILLSDNEQNAVSKECYKLNNGNKNNENVNNENGNSENGNNENGNNENGSNENGNNENEKNEKEEREANEVQESKLKDNEAQKNENLIKSESNKEEYATYNQEDTTYATNNNTINSKCNNIDNSNDNGNSNREEKNILSNGDAEDKIIKNYLNDQKNNANTTFNKEKENQSLHLDIRDSNSDADDIALLKFYNNKEIINSDKIKHKRLKKNEDSDDEEAIKKKSSINNNNNIITNKKENDLESEVSSDDICLLNLIKSDNVKLNKNTEQLSDKSSYNSDEIILIRSKALIKNTNKKKLTSNSSVNANVALNSNLNRNNSISDKKINNSVNKNNPKKVSVRRNSIKGNANKKNKKKKKERGKEKRRKRKKAKEKNVDKDYNDIDTEKNSIVIGTFDPRNRSNKEKLVVQLLIRWWYILPDWPPPDYNYEKELKNRKLKLVPLEEYEDKEDVDKNGFRKVYEISAFPGVFRDAMGTAYDLRDKGTCPCYNNLIKKTDCELLELICESIKNQLKCLKNSIYDETNHEKKMEKELKEAEIKLSRITKKKKNVK